MDYLLAARPGAGHPLTTRWWLILSVGFIVAEILPPSTHFGILCLAFGALGGAITSVYSTSLWLPWVVFLATSAALVPLLMPLARFLFAKQHPIHAEK